MGGTGGIGSEDLCSSFFKKLLSIAAGLAQPRNWTSLGCVGVTRKHVILEVEFLLYLYLFLLLFCSSFHNTDALNRCELVFENCFVPEENILGQEGKGVAKLGYKQLFFDRK